MSRFLNGRLGVGAGGQAVAAVIFAAALALVVPAIADSFWLSAFIAAAIYTITALGVGLLYGRLAIVSLCQAGLLGVGGWITLRLGFATDLPFLVLMLLAGLGTMVVGTLLLSVALRFDSLYVALISLMAAGALQVIFTAVGFPNGGGGFAGRVPVAEAPLTLPRPGIATADPAFFRYSVAIALVLFALVWLHLRTKPGRSWAAIRRSEISAASMGINVIAYKLWAVALASFTAGIAGALLAASVGSLDATLFPASQSILILAVVLVCGPYSLVGAVLTGALSQLLPALFTKLDLSGNWTLVLFGVGLAASLLSNPAGIAGQLSDAWRSLTARMPRGRRVSGANG